MISFEYVKTTFSPDVVIRLQTLKRLARNTRKAAHGNLSAPFEVLLEGLEMRLLRQGSQAFLESYPIVFSMLQEIAGIENPSVYGEHLKSKGENMPPLQHF